MNQDNSSPNHTQESINIHLDSLSDVFSFIQRATELCSKLSPDSAPGCQAGSLAIEKNVFNVTIQTNVITTDKFIDNIDHYSNK